ncbi:MAG TPA: MerR family transcriptional regulator [Polyangiales bacterium]|nr:MerR family transcriptional regulator [Polyangiales bacterium]
MAIQLPILNQPSRPATRARRTLRVGELARAAGKTVRALHLYEELGLLVPVERSKGGYRLYDEDALTRVRWISKLQEMGLSLSGIQDLTRQWEQSGSAPLAMAHVEQLLNDKLAETREQMGRLAKLEAELQASLDYLRTCPTCDPKQIVDACSSCELHDEHEHAPELVAGFRAQ